MNSTNAVLLMGGRGQRFKDAGYSTPKPFIAVHGLPMLQRVLENIECPDIARIFVVLPEEFSQRVERIVWDLPFSEKVYLESLPQQTRGSAETLLALDGILPPDQPFFTANCDQLIEGGVQSMIQHFEQSGSDVLIPVFPHVEGSFLFVQEDEGCVQAIGRDLKNAQWAAAGLYFFRSYPLIAPFLRQVVADRNIASEPCVTEALARLQSESHLVSTFHLINQFHPLGTPEELQTYLNRN